MSKLLKDQQGALLPLLRIACVGGSTDPPNGVPGPLAAKALSVLRMMFDHITDVPTCFDKEPLLFRVMLVSLTEGSIETADEVSNLPHSACPAYPLLTMLCMPLCFLIAACFSLLPLGFHHALRLARQRFP